MTCPRSCNLQIARLDQRAEFPSHGCRPDPEGHTSLCRELSLLLTSWVNPHWQRRRWETRWPTKCQLCQLLSSSGDRCCRYFLFSPFYCGDEVEASWLPIGQILFLPWILLGHLLMAPSGSNTCYLEQCRWGWVKSIQIEVSNGSGQQGGISL